MSEYRGSSANYHWSYTASYYFLGWFWALHLVAALLLAAVCIASFVEPWPLLVLGEGLLAAHGFLLMRKHGTKPIDLGLQNGVLVRLLHGGDHVVTAVPYEVSSCRWLGSRTLVASIRPQQQVGYKRLLGLGRQPLLLCADNSSADDRHRLAMFYFSGATTLGQPSNSRH